jgi:hypothetical protein
MAHRAPKTLRRPLTGERPPTFTISGPKRSRRPARLSTPACLCLPCASSTSSRCVARDSRRGAPTAFPKRFRVSERTEKNELRKTASAQSRSVGGDASAEAEALFCLGTSTVVRAIASRLSDATFVLCGRVSARFSSHRLSVADADSLPRLTRASLLRDCRSPVTIEPKRADPQAPAHD